MLVTTTSNIEGFRIVSYLGVVGGEAATGRPWSREDSTTLLRNATHAAFQDMRHLAGWIGANAIIGAHIDQEATPAGTMLIMVYGTAVYCLGEADEAPPASTDFPLLHQDERPPPPQDAVPQPPYPQDSR